MGRKILRSWSNHIVIQDETWSNDIVMHEENWNGRILIQEGNLEQSHSYMGGKPGAVA